MNPLFDFLGAPMHSLNCHGVVMVLWLFGPTTESMWEQNGRAISMRIARQGKSTPSSTFTSSIGMFHKLHLIETLILYYGTFILYIGLTLSLSVSKATSVTSPMLALGSNATRQHMKLFV